MRNLPSATRLSARPVPLFLGLARPLPYAAGLDLDLLRGLDALPPCTPRRSCPRGVSTRASMAGSSNSSFQNSEAPADALMTEFHGIWSE